jgi:hypothetical protein
VAWILRLMKMGDESETQSADVMPINRPYDLDNITTLGLTLAEGKPLLAGLQHSWLRVSDTTERSQIDQCISHQFHAVVPWLLEFKAQQKPLELVLPREGPLHAQP